MLCRGDGEKEGTRGCAVCENRGRPSIEQSDTEVSSGRNEADGQKGEAQREGTSTKRADGADTWPLRGNLLANSLCVNAQCVATLK